MKWRLSVLYDRSSN